MLRAFLPVSLLVGCSVAAAVALLLFTSPPNGQRVVVFAPDAPYIHNHLAVMAADMRVVRKGGMRFVLVVDTNNVSDADEKLKNTGALFSIPAILNGGCFYTRKK